MRRKDWAPKRAAVARALRATGNLTLSAERAKVSRDWVLRHRAMDPEFDRACRDALDHARAALDGHRAARGFRAPAGWGHLDGEQLVVRGHPGRRAMIARAPARGWSPAAEDRFLATLAATCNVKASCAAVGVSVPGAYHHRKRWPAFAARWQAALDEGYVRLEAGLLEAGCNLFSAREAPAEVEMGSMTVDHALQLLSLHQNQVRGTGKPIGPSPRRLTMDEVRPGIIRKFEAIANMRTMDEPAMARARAEWARRAGMGAPPMKGVSTTSTSSGQASLDMSGFEGRREDG